MFAERHARLSRVDNYCSTPLREISHNFIGVVAITHLSAVGGDATAAVWEF